MLRVGDQVKLVSSRPGPYRRGWVDMKWERADDPLLGRVGRVTFIDPDGTFQLDIDPRGGWFAPTWVTPVAADSARGGGDETSGTNQVGKVPSPRVFRGRPVPDPYRVLEVAVNARQSVIEKAYRAIMLEDHPDRGGDSARAQQVNAAYEILRDAATRREFDEENGIVARA